MKDRIMQKKTDLLLYTISIIFFILLVDLAAYIQLDIVLQMQLYAFMFIIPSLNGLIFGLLLSLVHYSYTKYKRMQHFEDIALHDTLTHALSRFGSNLFLDNEHKTFLRYQQPYSLLMIDIDHFKKINDTFGHITGDKVLIQLVKTIQEHLRQPDNVCRWGGEEFLVILPNTSLEAAKVTAEKLRQTVESTKFTDINKITISIGVSSVDTTCNNYNSVVTKADKALYKAKNNGRNRVCA
jgi:diguanylate cyclase (GGDEF)-like protein